MRRPRTRLSRQPYASLEDGVEIDVAGNRHHPNLVHHFRGKPAPLGNFDASMFAAALRARCSLLWSEDMQDGMTIDGRLRIANPFRI